MKNIFNWFMSLFKKNNISSLPESSIQPEIKKETQNFFEELKVKDSIYEIKYKFENGIIGMADMTTEQIIQLTNIYNEDTIVKKKKIEILKQKIEQYKNGNDNNCYNN